jgi:hypothetical protein
MRGGPQRALGGPTPRRTGIRRAERVGGASRVTSCFSACSETDQRARSAGAAVVAPLAIHNNLFATERLATPACLRHHCLTAPVDPRLPGGGGPDLRVHRSQARLFQVTPNDPRRPEARERCRPYTGFDVNLNMRLKGRQRSNQGQHGTRARRPLRHCDPITVGSNTRTRRRERFS